MMKKKAKSLSKPTKINISESEDDNYVMMSSLSGKIVSDYEMQTVKMIMDRHTSNDEDMFGRIDIGLSQDAISRISKGLWPYIPIQKNLMVVNENTGELIVNAYNSLSDDMLHKYVDFMIKNNAMKSTSKLSDYPIIDVCGFIVKKDNQSVFRSADPLNFNFTKKDIQLLYLSGQKVFMPRFDQFFIKTNKNRYLFIDIENYQNNSIIFNVETYIGNKKFWIKTFDYKAELIFLKSNDLRLPCEINMLSGTAYEQILTKYISKMNWSAKHIRFWCDMFRIPETLDQITAASLRDESAFDPDETEVHLLLYTPSEVRIMKKIYGDCFSIEKDTQSAINNNLRVYQIPELIKNLSKIYTYMYNYAKPVKITKTSDGRFNQNFGRINIISREFYF